MVGRRVVDLLAMSLNLTEFFLECGLISAGWATPIEFGVVPLRGGAIPRLFI
jgi:hypothetical protein